MEEQLLPVELPVVPGTLKARAAAAGGARSSSPGLLPRWCRYCYCKTGQGTEMCYSKSATLHWPKGRSFADVLGQNRSFLIRLRSLVGLGFFLALVSTVSL